MNLGQLRSAVRVRTGYQATDPKISDSALNDIINAALHHLETIADWSYLQATETLSTVVGQDTLTPSAYRRRTKSLTVVGGDYRYPLDEFGVDELDEQWGDPGSPAGWCDWAGTLILRPVPDAVYTVSHRYIRAEADLTGDSASPLAPVEFQWGLVEYAAYLTFRRDHDQKEALAAQDAFVQWVSSLRDNRRRGASPVVPQIRDWT